MAEKTEQATPKKLRDARKKGQVAKSQDFPSAVTFIVSIATTLISAGYLFEVLASYIISMFKLSSTNIDMQNGAAGIFTQAIQVIFNTSMPIVALTVCVGLLTNFLVVGPLFSLESMKPDIKRLNPVSNIKNMFKFKTVFELLKSIFKISGALILIYSVVWSSIPEIIATAALPVQGAAAVFSSFLIKVIIRVGIFFLVIAVFDLVFQKRNFAKEMKMEKFEVKQEYKDTEGDPHIKSKRRQTAQEIAYQEGPMSVKRAKAVITNPVHIAVAIEYNTETEPAPKIVTMGKGTIADLIMKIAQENGVPIMRNVTLAQTLFEKGKISDYIPEDTYQAVAEILRWLEGLETLETSGLELFK
ncbi:MAG: type III secretion system export apparatus subunit SctU [Verrucomicrobia bacterium]|nr:type III secretion system export apparatus subunit SctU [Verrucomicrobiota bacterium]